MVGFNIVGLPATVNVCVYALMMPQGYFIGFPFEKNPALQILQLGLYIECLKLYDHFAVVYKKSP